MAEGPVALRGDAAGLLDAPSLRVAVLESEIAGFGASGRNGGWCSALYPVGISTLAAEAGRDAAIAQYRAMQDAAGDGGRVRLG